MGLNIGKFATEGNEFLKAVAEELNNNNDRDQAGRITRSVLHAIRAKLTPQQSMHFISQLPMFLKAVYVDGWHMTNNLSKMRSREEFLQEIRQCSQDFAGRDFGNDQEAAQRIRAVFRVIRRYVSEGEINDIKLVLPKGIRELLEDEPLLGNFQSPL